MGSKPQKVQTWVSILEWSTLPCRTPTLAMASLAWFNIDRLLRRWSGEGRLSGTGGSERGVCFHRKMDASNYQALHLFRVSYQKALVKCWSIQLKILPQIDLNNRHSICSRVTLIRLIAAYLKAFNKFKFSH